MLPVKPQFIMADKFRFIGLLSNTMEKVWNTIHFAVQTANAGGSLHVLF